MGNDFRRGIRVYLETSDYSKGISELVNQNKKLNTEYEQLKNKAEALSSSEQKRLKQLKSQLEKNAQTEASYKQKLKETEAVLNNLSGSTYNDLIKVQNRLQKEVKETVRGTQEHTTKLEQYNRVTKEVTVAQKEMNMVVGAQGSAMSKAAGFVNKFFGLITGGIAILSGVVLSIKGLITSNAKLDDSFANVMKTTGLTREEVISLNKEFKTLNTRTSREELNQLATEAGKLGIEGSRNIMDFVEAGNQIRVALGEDLGEDAIKNIGKMVGVFDKSTKHLQGLGLKEQMLSVGSAINELGASSSASEEYLVDFAGRLGGVASQAGISMDAILGFGSALDQDMQKVEMSATALQNFIMKVMGDTAKFAEIAGLEVGKFTRLLQTDANSAIKSVLRSLNEKGGFQALIPIFNEMGLDGARAVGVLSSMASSIDKIDEAQKIANRSMTEGTSITREYDIKNNNLAANLAKLGKNIAGWFTSSGITNAMNEGIEAMTILTSKSKTLTQVYDDEAEKVAKLDNNIRPLLYRYDLLSQKAHLSATDNAEMKSIIEQVTAVMPGAITQMDAYGNAIAISTQRVREYINAEVDRLKYVNQKAIEENKKALKKNVAEYIEAAKIMEQIQSGTWKTSAHDSEGNKLYFTPSQEEIQAATENYKRLKSVVNGNMNEILRLDGTHLKQQITNNKNNQLERNNDLNNEIIYQNSLKDAKSGGNNEKPWDVEIEAAEKAYKIEKLLYSGMLKQKLISQEMYEIISLQREINFMKDKQAILENYKQSSIDVQQDIINAEIKLQEKNKKIDIPSIKALNVDKEALAEGLKAYMNNIEDKRKAEAEFLEWKKQHRQKEMQDTVAVAQYVVDAVKAYHQMEADSLEAEKQRELTAAGDNAEAREAIEKKYAQKELDLKKKQANIDMTVNIAMAIANGALAITKALADLGPIAGPIAAVAIGATTLFQIGSIIKQRDAIMATTLDGSSSSSSASTSTPRVANSTIKTPQAAEGRWDVVGASDGRTYRNVPYRGVARTGIYRSPVLVAERGDELIVDNPTLRNIRMDAPHLLAEINRYRVRQYADGKWDAASQSAGSQSDLTAILAANTSIMDKLYALLEWYQTNRIEAYTVLSEFEAKRDLRDKSLKKGSLS